MRRNLVSGHVVERVWKLRVLGSWGLSVSGLVSRKDVHTHGHSRRPCVVVVAMAMVAVPASFPSYRGEIEGFCVIE